MNKNDLMKWLLIAGAVYLGYRYLQSSGLLAKILPGAQPGAQPDAAVLPSAASPVIVATPPQIAAPVATTPTVAQALTAAMRTQGYDPQAAYNGFEWNWFWQRTPFYNGVDIGPTELGIGNTDKVYMSDAVVAIRKIVTGVQGLGLLESLVATPRMLSAWN